VAHAAGQTHYRLRHRFGQFLTLTGPWDDELELHRRLPAGAWVPGADEGGRSESIENLDRVLRHRQRSDASREAEEGHPATARSGASVDVPVV
jgi:hypothetical protein